MRRLSGLAALLLALAGCASTPPTLGDPAPGLKDERAEKAYQETLERFTARDEVYAVFDTVLFAATTFQTPAFREARVRRRAEFQHIPAPRVEEMLAEERTEAAQAHTFFLGVHANDPQYDDFDRRNSIWRLALLTQAGEARPTSIRRIGRTNLDLRAIYPYMGTFWVGYRVDFPTTFPDGTPVLPQGTERVTLRVASTLGTADLVMSAQ
jgi:hypothetical protein